MRTLLHRFKSFSSSSDKRSLLREAFGTALVQGSSMVLVFLVNVAMARLGGEENYGIYTHIFNWLYLGWMIASFGTDSLVMKEVSLAHSRGDTTRKSQVLAWSNRKVLGISFAVLGVFLLLVWTLPIKGFEGYEWYFSLGALAIPLMAIMMPSQAYLRGEGQVALGQTAERIIKPLGTGLLLLFTFFYYENVSAQQLIGYNLLGIALASLFAFILLLKIYKKRTPSLPPSPTWQKSAWNFMLISLLYVLTTRVDMLILGAYVAPEEVGYYNVALKISDILVLPAFIINHAISPKYADYFFNNKKEKLQKLLRDAIRVIFGMTLILYIIYILLGDWLLGIYGTTYAQEGYEILLILGGTKVFAALVGPVGYLLMMTGFERQSIIALTGNIIVSLVLGFTLIPLLGKHGAAWATFAGITTYNTLIFIYLYKKTGIRAGII